MNKNLNKIILLIIMALFTFHVTQLKAAYHKQEDFYGNWIITGFLQYGCNKSQISNLNEVKNYWFLDMTSNDIIVDTKPNDEYFIFNKITISGKERLYYMNEIAQLDSGYRSSKYFIPPPIVKIYNQTKKFSKCGAYDVLNITDKSDNDPLIIINKNKLIYFAKTEDSIFYFILEKQGTIPNEKKLELYFYDTEEVRGSDIVVEYQNKGFDVHFRPWKPNEDITEVVN